MMVYVIGNGKLYATRSHQNAIQGSGLLASVEGINFNVFVRKRIYIEYGMAYGMLMLKVNVHEENTVGPRNIIRDGGGVETNTTQTTTTMTPLAMFYSSTLHIPAGNSTLLNIRNAHFYKSLTGNVHAQPTSKRPQHKRNTHI